QHGLERLQASSIDGWLPKAEVNSHRGKRVAHVVMKLGMEFEFFKVTEVVCSEARGIAAGQIHKVEHSGVLGVRPPVLGEAGQQIGVERQSFLRSRILAEQRRVEVLSEFGGISVSM